MKASCGKSLGTGSSHQAQTFQLYMPGSISAVQRESPCNWDKFMFACIFDSVSDAVNKLTLVNSPANHVTIQHHRHDYDDVDDDDVGIFKFRLRVIPMCCEAARVENEFLQSVV
mmetsp:Transcript_105129/g.181679  ORF Transcript_105129/g.181679 Transcript_105129/m.181679 type:complete len:114 (+) Transcript_105129:492-833(+)